MGLYFYDEKPENVVETMWLVDPALNIPAGESNYQSWSSFTTEHEAVLFDFTPHMHLRGKTMRFTAEYPNGEKEILLDVPKYDFNWQTSYRFIEPKHIPAGTKVTFTGTSYINSTVANCEAAGVRIIQQFWVRLVE
jgi:hypothetical protein